MSDCLEMCLWIIDSGVSIGTSAWGVCVYSISEDQMVLTGSILKSGCFSDILCIAVYTGVNCCEFMVIMNIFLSLIWIYGLVCYTV